MKRQPRVSSKQVLERMRKAGLVPVVVIEDPNKALQLGRTLLDAGLGLIEITLRTEKAVEAIRVLSEQLPEMLVGAGTVFSVAAARQVLSSGAKFIVSPHLDEQLVTYCASKDVVSIPGVFTPTEVQRAITAAKKGSKRNNIRDLPLVIKIFPASTGGPGHITAMRAVFPDVRFMPLGGVNAETVTEYVKGGAWAVGGTWICKKDLVDSSNFRQISQLTKNAVALVAAARNVR
ncbi:MAG TPA: bifunctional 4-hydroxy-2-oxoglutarate aldolase/2-dehydro-3-deoxy-phosphogluconate aldolase [Candidatus Acidoferrales bacterium]|nr:bifunctional 4-hydroxy-2-oxoglutarate aldolase/2-dehydro-3-deoxy-phosphogluconate aldolase [Candidatus Acidoferrales bacterium]